MYRFAGHTLRAGALALTTATLAASAAQAQPSTSEETPSLRLHIAGSVKMGHPAQFSGSSEDLSSTQQYLTVFLAPPRIGYCPVTPKAPRGADRLLHNEPVDNFLSIRDLSDNLKIPGHWHLCGYLTNSGASVSASSAVPFVVRGRRHHRGAPAHHHR
jgi:hypothetical protein